MTSKYPQLSNLRNLSKNSSIITDSYQNYQNGLSLGQNRSQRYFTSDQTKYQWIKLHKIKQHNLETQIQQLYKSSKYQNATLYGFNLWLLRKQLEQNNKINIKILWSLFQTLNWQNLSIKNIEQYLMNFPTKENQVEEIQISNDKIKLNKLNMCLQVNIIEDTYNLVPKQYEFNRFIGKNYQKSLTKISNTLNSYQFKDTILQIESNQYITAVRTPLHVFLINTEGKMNQFNIITKDIKISQNKCFFSKIDNSIGNIFMQTSYTPKLNSFAIEQIKYSDILHEGQFFVSDNRFIGIIDVNFQQKYLSIRKLQGQKSYFDLKIHANYNENIVSKKAFIHGSYLHLLFFMGMGKTITKIIQYKFYISFT